MNDRVINFGRDALTGRSRGLGAVLFRTAASLIEPLYSTAMTVRNIGCDRGWIRSFDLGRPTISVGNITTGGTGKTPVVRWLADRLREAGHRPAVLMRGYGSGPGGQSDEQMLLYRGLNTGGDPRPIPVMANPSRIDGAAAVLAADPDVDRFILDDGFQHRRAKRVFDLVLINATDPYGGGRVLPRGLLREPIRGLRRADAVLITRSSMVPADGLYEIRHRLEKLAPGRPIFYADHKLSIDAGALRGRQAVAVSGIGDPESFERQLTEAGVELVDQMRFGDHHNYTTPDVAAIDGRASDHLRLTTEKDWVKLEPLVRPEDRGRWRVIGVRIRFTTAADEQQLLGLIDAACVDATDRSLKAAAKSGSDTLINVPQ